MRIRFYVDEDAMARTLVNGLRARSVDVATVADDGKSGLNDIAQLVHAVKQERAIYTFNVGHFCQLHKEYMMQGKDHFGIIVVPRQRYAVGEQIKRLLNLINTKTSEEMKNELWFL